MNSEDPLNLLTLPEPPIIEEVEVNTVGLEVELVSDSCSVGGDSEIDKSSEKESEVKDSKVASGVASEDKNEAGRILEKEVDGDTFEVPAPPPVSRSLTPPLIKAGPSSSSPTTRLYSPHHKSKKELEEEDERERMQLLVSNFSEGQYDRYEMFRRSTFPKAAIKRIMQTITGNAVSQNVVIAMSGIAKVFVGEVVEEALDAMERMGDTGPLRPKHLRESVRRLRNERCSIPRSNTKKFNPFSL